MKAQSNAALPPGSVLIQPGQSMTQGVTLSSLQPTGTNNVPSGLQVWAPAPPGPITVSGLGPSRSSTNLVTLPSGQTVLMTNLVTTANNTSIPLSGSSSIAKPQLQVPSGLSPGNPIVISSSGSNGPLATQLTAPTVIQGPNGPISVALSSGLITNSSLNSFNGAPNAFVSNTLGTLGTDQPVHIAQIVDNQLRPGSNCFTSNTGFQSLAPVNQVILDSTSFNLNSAPGQNKLINMSGIRPQNLASTPLQTVQTSRPFLGTSSLSNNVPVNFPTELTINQSELPVSRPSILLTSTMSNTTNTVTAVVSSNANITFATCSTPNASNINQIINTAKTTTIPITSGVNNTNMITSVNNNNNKISTPIISLNSDPSTSVVQLNEQFILNSSEPSSCQLLSVNNTNSSNLNNTVANTLTTSPTVVTSTISTSTNTTTTNNNNSNNNNSLITNVGSINSVPSTNSDLTMIEISTSSDNTTQNIVDIKCSSGEQSNTMFLPASLAELLTELDPQLQLDPDAEKVISDLANEFIISCAQKAQKLAAHRGSSTVDAKDVLFCMERDWNVVVPGYVSEVRPLRTSFITEAHKQRLALIKKQIKKM